MQSFRSTPRHVALMSLKGGAPRSGAKQLRHKCGEVSKPQETHLLNRRFGAELVRRRGSAGMIVAGSEQC